MQSNFYLGYPDIEGRGKAFDCGKPGYTGHTGTDITVASVKGGIAVMAAADGEVLLVAGGKEDHCSGDDESPGTRCLQDTATTADPGAVCLGANGCFSWGFDAGNFILIRHNQPHQILYTLYAHLRRGSIAVTTGQQVKKGDKIAEAGNSGASLAPHLHFGVFARMPYGNDAVDPWQGSCSANHHQSLWQYTPPYRAEIAITKSGTGEGIITCDSGSIPCTSRYPISLVPGTTITLKAVPYYGSEFAGWQGACAGSGSICTLAVEGAVAIKAVFTREERNP